MRKCMCVPVGVCVWVRIWERVVPKLHNSRPHIAARSVFPKHLNINTLSVQLTVCVCVCVCVSVSGCASCSSFFLRLRTICFVFNPAKKLRPQKLALTTLNSTSLRKHSRFSFLDSRFTVEVLMWFFVLISTSSSFLLLLNIFSASFPRCFRFCFSLCHFLFFLTHFYCSSCVSFLFDFNNFASSPASNFCWAWRFFSLLQNLRTPLHCFNLFSLALIFFGLLYLLFLFLFLFFFSSLCSSYDTRLCCTKRNLAIYYNLGYPQHQ